MSDDLQIQWKVGTKRPRVQVKSSEEEVVEEEQREYVLSIEGTKIDVKDDGTGASNKKNGPMVIPLVNGIPKSATHVEAESLDAKATQEILHDLGLAPSSSNGNTTTGKTILIEQNKENGNKKAPLLLQNIPEEVRNAKNDEEKFKYDIANRAEDISVKSEAYNSIPVEEFGAALLRGMGWNGDETNPSGNQTKELSVRPSRLGLGAAPKLQENKKKSGNHRSSDQTGSTLNVGGYVQILDQSKYHERRAIISKASGVPGLNRIRVIIEKYGDEYDVPKSAIRVLNPKELETKPFKFPKPVEPKADSDGRAEPEKAQQKSSSSKSSSGTTEKNSTTKESNSVPKVVDWIRPNLKVKLISKKYGDHLYLRKGYIVDVVTKGYATLKLENGAVVDSVAEKHLETSLPTIGGNCMVIHGEHKGEIATLMQKQNDVAVIQVSDSLDIIQINLDWVAGVLLDM